MNVLQRIGQVAGGAILAAIFGPLAWYFGIDPLATAVGNWQQAADYLEVPATVETRTGRDADGTFEYLVLRYEREGKPYETTRMTVLEDTDIDTRANAQVIERMRRSDTKPSVWVSPRRPDVAVASRDLPWTSMWPRLPMTIGFTLLALAGALGALFAAVGRNMAPALLLTGFAGAWSGFALPAFTLIAGEGTSVDVGATVGIGLFALIGVGLAFAAFVGTLRPGEAVASSAARSASGGPQARIRTVGGAAKPPKAASGKAAAAPAPGVKRGGMGGRGSGFDRE